MMTDEELQQLVTANARKIQAMLERQAAHGWENEEQRTEFRQALLELARIEEELINKIASNRRRSSDSGENIDVDEE